MTEQNRLRRIERALISVSDKTGIIEFARALREFNIEIISTGGTAKHLREAGIEIRDISALTGYPEMMDGRLKTLHPRVHGALLALRDNSEHVRAMQEHEIEPIDMVVVNLYPFEETIKREGVTLEEAIEQIDIGGPAMIRSAAKNFRDVAVIVSPTNYSFVVEQLRKHSGALALGTRAALAEQAFRRTSQYDELIPMYLGHAFGGSFETTHSQMASFPWQRTPSDSDLPVFEKWRLTKVRELRYGENPHQQAALYDSGETGGVANAELLSGKEMSYNNYVDADAAWQLVSDFEETTCAIIKHTNPAGVGQGERDEVAYRKALATDPLSAFGGIVAFNRAVDEPAARAVVEIFTEVIIAPDYDPASLEILKAKKNLRVLKAVPMNDVETLEYRQISGGMLIQTRDTHRLRHSDLRVVSERKPTEEELTALLFAWKVCKHTKSNAIVYARAGQTVGVGAGQMSRVDSVKLGAMRAQLPVKGSVLASDAFFPFRDGIDEAAKHGITAVIQPGGSMKDSEVIAAANEHGLAMVFTGIRHFKH
ncbi:MAG TPA: bifunctional phosphoribosylaminoimidazolecarboxamide formyltransferase/IMP cyclohydrolase [Pyrinomonadaceae bacterium]|nr:bifunctional phosphoribosylaminoimidazolecarboxamide formyltransferase/IMP cyclohydrolase [Pyrinomonadaceae bacterium]